MAIRDTTRTEWHPVSGEVYATLTRAGKDSLDPLKAAHEQLAEVARRVDLAQSELHVAIYDSLQAKVPARVIADTLGISASRVYQIRDEVSRHRVAAPAPTPA